MSAVAVIRIGFAAVLLLKLIHSADARRLVWAHRTPPGGPVARDIGLAALIVADVCLLVGFATGPAALVTWALYVWLFHYASLRCLEDILVQTVATYLIFAGAGAALSIDALLGSSAPSWGRLPAGTVLPEIALTIAMGWVLLSAGLAKLGSPLWRGGLACYYFFLLPNVRRIDTSPLTKRRTLMVALNHLTIAVEIAYLPWLLVDGGAAALALWAMVVGFTVMLLVVFVVDYIGEVQLLGLLGTGALLWQDGGPLGGPGLAALAISDLAATSDPAARWLGIALLVSLLPCGWAALAPRHAAAPLRGFDRAARRIARYTWGTTPVTAFTELHLRGPVVYEVRTPGGEVAWPIFTEACRPGPARRLRPTFFETMAYKVTDACVELDARGRLEDPARERFILRLAEFAARKARRRLGRDVDALVFRVTQIQPPDAYVGPSEWYLKDWRVDAFRVDLRDGAAVAVRPLRRPILKYPTGRDLHRASFRFAVA